MMTGRFLHRFSPYLQTGTHYTINRLAAFVVRKKVPDDFPHWRAINEHEGMNGIDGLWLQNKHEASRSTYNPITQQGSGLEEMQEQYNVLVESWARQDSAATARQLAYVSHIITDICTPPHQHGKLVRKPKRRWQLFWLKNDWYESLDERGLADQHFQFEMSLLYKLIWRPLRRSRLNRAVLDRFYRTPGNRRRDVLRRHMQNVTGKIRRLNIYPEFVERGWTKRIDRAMRCVVVPNIVSTVATTWYLGISEGQANRSGSADFASTGYYPLVGRKRL